MTDRPFPRESGSNRLRHYSPLGPGGHIGGMVPPLWPRTLPLAPPPLPRGGSGPLPPPVPLQVNPLHMAGRMPTSISHYPLPLPMPHTTIGNPMYSLGNMQRCMEPPPWPSPNLMPSRSRVVPSERAFAGVDEAGLRDAARQPTEETYTVGRRRDDRASSAASDSSVIVQGGAMAGEPSRTVPRHTRRPAPDESSKSVGRSTSVIVNNHSSSPRSTNCPSPSPTPTSKPSSGQHTSDLMVAVSSSASSDPRATPPCTPGACPVTDAVSGSTQDLPTTTVKSSALPFTVAASIAVAPSTIATSSLVTPPTTPVTTTTALPTTAARNSAMPPPTIATSTLLAPPTTAIPNMVTPPTIAVHSTVVPSTSLGSSVKEPTTGVTSSAVKLLVTTESATLSQGPVATPSVETPPTVTSPSSPPITTGAARPTHSSHLRGDVAAPRASKQHHLPAQPDKKPIIVDSRALGSTQPTSDHTINSSVELGMVEIDNQSKCDAECDTGPLGKSAAVQNTPSGRKRPASLLDCQSSSLPICDSLKPEPEEVVSSCKRFVISSLGDDVNAEPSMDTRENPRISPHPSGSAASDDSDVTIDLESYDEDDNCCNHNNLDVVPGENFVAGDCLLVCNKCQHLLRKNGDKLHRVELNQDHGTYIRAQTACTSSHGESPEEYLIKPDLHALLQSRRAYLASHPVAYPLPSARILSLVCPPPPSMQNSTVTCFKVENEVHRSDVPTTSKYKNGRHVRMSKASNRAKKERSKSVISLDSTDETSVASGDSDSASSSDSTVVRTPSVQRSSPQAVLNHLPPHPLGLARLRNGRPSTAINGQGPNSPPVQGKSGMRLATSPAYGQLAVNRPQAFGPGTCPTSMIGQGVQKKKKKYSPSSSLCLMDVESISFDLTEYSPVDSERGRWSMEDVTELGAGLDRQSLELLQDFSPEDVVQWKKLKVKRSTGETPLHQACSRGLMSMAKYFLQVERMSPDVQDNAGWTPLHEACSHRHHSVARLLLGHRANPSVCAHDGTMPIHDAVEANDLAGVKLLVEYGAGIAPESGERLPLEIAKSKGFVTITEYLQDRMDKTSRAELQSSEGHSSSLFDGMYSGDAKLAGQSYRLDDFSLGPELDFPLFFLTPFFDECERQIPVAFNLAVPEDNSGRRHNFYLMDHLVKSFGLSEVMVRQALEETGLRTHVIDPGYFRKQIKQSNIYVIPRALCNSHKLVELVPDCSVMHDLLGIKRVDIEQ